MRPVRKDNYKLTVRQLREDVTDQNIVIEDKLETQGASIVKDSIFVKKNGIELKDAKIEADDTGFVIQIRSIVVRLWIKLKSAMKWYLKQKAQSLKKL